MFEKLILLLDFTWDTFLLALAIGVKS